MNVLRNIAFIAAIALASGAEAQLRTEEVRFAAGTSGASIAERIVGSEEVRYQLDASAGQSMQVDLATSNLSAYFNIFAPGDIPGQSSAMFIGSISGTSYSGTLQEDGTYTIQVFLNRNAARRGEVADYRLSVSVNGTATVQPDFADSLAGGPDWWAVTGVSNAGRLNVRAGPSTGDRVVATVPNGFVFRNLGCGQRTQRWCEVEAADGHFSGWVAGRFLRESSRPPGAKVASSHSTVRPGRPEGDVPALFQRDTGEFEVSWSGGCQVLVSPSGREIAAGQTCSAEQRDRARDAVERYRREQRKP